MAKYKIDVDRDACVGDGLCCEEAPATFEADDTGRCVVKDPCGDPPEDILLAARRCRLEAIALHDIQTGAKVWP